MLKRPFRFGLQTDGGDLCEDPHDCLRSLTKLARRAEELGFSTFTLPDHFGRQLAPMVALGALAAATERIRLGCTVWCNDYRNPLVFAKELATLDVLSGGRAQLGLGAGWMKADYDAAGLPFDSPGVRIERMAEALRVMRGLFSPGPFSFEGKHYRIQEHDAWPKPIQQPHPPILIGGGGRKMLALAAREADIVGISVKVDKGEMGAEATADTTAEATERKLTWIREAAGTRFEKLELQIFIYDVRVTDDRAATLAEMAPDYGLPPEVMADVPHVLVGTLEQIAEQLLRQRERYGITYSTFGTQHMEVIAPLLSRPGKS